jgi:hypothetical protein
MHSAKQSLPKLFKKNLTTNFSRTIFSDSFKFAMLIGFLGLGVSCSRHQEAKLVKWNGQGTQPKLDNKEFAISAYTKVAGENLSLGYQKIAGAKVEGSFYKKIETPLENLKLDLSGREISKEDNINYKDSYLVASYFETWPKELEKKIHQMRGQVATVIPSIQRLQKRFKDLHYDKSPEVIVANLNGVLTPMYQVIYIDRIGAAYVLKITDDFKIYSENRTGTSFADAIALVFPEGPKFSDLVEVPLKKLFGDGTLKNDYLEVTTASTATIKQGNESFRFQPPDEKFDQVQVFFFVNKALDWYKEQLGVNINRKLKVITHFGYPAKENSMFYFDGTVRLGAGDDDSYSKIPLDPSIVMHETTHALVEEVAHLSYENEAGSINEAYADFLSCSVLKSPLLGDVAYKKGPFKRNLVNNLKLSDKNGAKYHDSGIISGTFWELRDKIGEQKALTLSIRALSRLNPQSDFADFKLNLLESVRSLSAEDQAKVEGTLVARGWK